MSPYQWRTERKTPTTAVLFSHIPAELSHRKITSLQGRIECNSVDSEDGLSRGKTESTIDKPIFKSRAKAFFTVSYGRNKQPRRILSANATSGNRSIPLRTLQKEWIDRGSTYLFTFESTLSYTNFTFEKNNLQKPVQQTIVVTNDIRPLNFTVVIKVPVKLGDKDIWVDSNSLQIPECQRDRDEEPNVTDFVAQIQKNKVVDCSVAKCGVFKCTRFMGRSERKNYIISANLSSGWIEQIGLESAKFLLTSTASLAGFFKSKYKEMINEGAEGADPQADGGATSPEA
ncbi:integrin alpha-M-like protein [Lates japonicus]|uniref:Integrin alpha-M-like protein n=1 Tax=Lates japonicus TaxID=270547 RepID=A0AAD3R4U6_LATJO|nr:integrin alpha-M-like protein [Lates japonicus]